ncbi:hypothetical protein RE6C_04548 [Rhodopirellula europaea 6C]|uniref:Uncharacterized protein n=1 Tax=Rhodopirellula europaea 6C TaxID=1263867 RepID=M2A4P2_9BACT|nr:hypothetical protein RE6C_04548 [Rhodopirellula europaea 6C]
MRALEVARWNGSRLILLSLTISENEDAATTSYRMRLELAWQVEPATKDRGWVGF